MKLSLLTLSAVTTDAPAIPSPSPTPTIEVTATPPPAPSPTPDPPTHTPTPSPTTVDRTRSLETVELVIAALEVHDVDALESLVRYTEVPCDDEKSFEGPTLPHLRRGALGHSRRRVPGRPMQPCLASESRPMIQRFVERAGSLLAVIENPEQTVDLGVPRNH